MDDEDTIRQYVAYIPENDAEGALSSNLQVPSVGRRTAAREQQMNVRLQRPAKKWPSCRETETRL